MTLLRHVMFIKSIFKVQTWTILYGWELGLFNFWVSLYILQIVLFSLFKIGQLHLRTLLNRYFLMDFRLNLIFYFLFHNRRILDNCGFPVKFQINDCCWNYSNYSNRYDANNDNDGTIAWLIIWVCVIENRIGLLTLINLELSCFIY